VGQPKRRSWWKNGRTGQLVRVAELHHSREGELLEVVVTVRDATGVALVDVVVDPVEFEHMFRRIDWTGE